MKFIQIYIIKLYTFMNYMIKTSNN